MPYNVRKRKCKQADGKSGDYAVVKEKADGEEQSSCHTNKDDAEASIRARHMNERGIMRIKKRQLKRIIKEETAKILEAPQAYGDSTYRYADRSRGNPPPPRDSNWRAFADKLDMGVLDLDGMAYDLGFSDFRDMDISISPSALANRGPDLFVQAAQDSSMIAMDMSRDQILTVADMPGMM